MHGQMRSRAVLSIQIALCGLRRSRRLRATKQGAWVLLLRRLFLIGGIVV
jgi:hypothetical protein